MERIVFDANVWVSAAAFPSSIPDQAIDLVRLGCVQSLISEALIGQVCRSLATPRFDVSNAIIARLELQMRTLSEFIVPDIHLAVIAAKESDNRVLECAVAGRADVIVTGDRKHLLSLGNYAGIPLLSPRDFLERIEP